MAEKVTVEGKIGEEPFSHELKAKVQHALMGALQSELTIKGPTPGIGHHFSVTHFSVVFDQA